MYLPQTAFLPRTEYPLGLMFEVTEIIPVHLLYFVVLLESTHSRRNSHGEEAESTSTNPVVVSFEMVCLFKGKQPRTRE